MRSTDERAQSALLRENDVTKRFLDPGRGRSRSLSQHTGEYERSMRGRRLFANRPVLLDEVTLRGLESDLDQFASLLFSLPDRLFGGDLRAMMRAVDMPERQLAAMAALTPPGPPVRLGRADLFLEDSGFKLLEFNASCSLGGWDIETLNRAYLHDPEFRSFTEQEGLTYAPTLQMIVDTMLADIGPLDASERPMIVLADWPHTLDNIRPILETVSGMLGDLGYRAQPCHLGELDHRTDGVYLNGVRVDVVFRLFLPKGLLTGGDEAYSLLYQLYDSVTAGRVKLFADFGLNLYEHKGCLTLLSDERNAHAFSDDERALLGRLLPWTRMLRAEPDLIAHVKANRERMLLKPSFEYGGQGIVAGWRLSDEEWSAAVDTSVTESYVVQERVRPVTERFLDDETGQLAEWIVNWGIFVTPFGYGGTLARSAPDPDAPVISARTKSLCTGGFHVDPALLGRRQS